MYVLGGARANSTVTNSIYIATFNVDGTITNWNRNPTPLPIPLMAFSVGVYNNRLYVIVGNFDNGASDYVNTVYIATINADGTLNWKTHDTGDDMGVSLEYSSAQ